MTRSSALIVIQREIPLEVSHTFSSEIAVASVKHDPTIMLTEEKLSTEDTLSGPKCPSTVMIRLYTFDDLKNQNFEWDRKHIQDLSNSNDTFHGIRQVALR